MKMATVKPARRGQKPIHFKRGALTRQARAAGKSIGEMCARPSTGLIARRCNSMRNVLTGPKG